MKISPNADRHSGRHWAGLAILALALSLSACDVVEDTTGISASNSSGSSATVTAASWTDANGFVQFLSNSSADYAYTFLQTYDDVWPNIASPVVSTVTGTVEKVSGATGYGNGLIWGYSDSSDFYAVLIDDTGDYTIQKFVKGTQSAVIDWTYTSYLTAGYSKQNSLAITYSLSKYRLYINGSLVYSFSPDSTLGTKGSVGFYANVGSSSDESFPGTPVKVLFTMSSPLAKP
jgi:hypothetical protein